MRILHLAYRDTAGVPGRWAQAQRDAGHEARILVEFEHPFAYPAYVQVRRWTPGSPSAIERAERIAPMLIWADVVMAYDHPFYLDAAIASHKPVLFRALGGSSRAHADEIGELLEASNVVRATTGTADLALLLCIELVGAPYPLPDPAKPTDLVLCHAPSDRETKGTDAVLRAARETGWRVDLVEDMPNADVLARKRQAALVVDSIGPDSIPDGYGVNGVEGMAMGLPVVTSASESVRRMWSKLGSPVVFAETESELCEVLIHLRDADVRHDLGAAGREFVATFHSGIARASEDIDAVTDLRGAQDEGQGNREPRDHRGA